MNQNNMRCSISVISFSILFLATGVFPIRTLADDCKKVMISDFPPKDLPSDADREDLIGEPSKKFYYGIGIPVDYVKARYAAFLEMENLMEDKTERDNDEIFGGANVLMMLYANGLGVQRNLDLSIRLASCNVPGSLEEIQNRVDHLKRLKWIPFTKSFDFCDDVSGDSSMRIRCEDLKAERVVKPFETELDTKLKKIKGLTDKWTPKTTKAFDFLKTAANDYFYKRMYKEVDSSGTDRNKAQSEEYEKLQNDFVKELNEFEKGSYPHYSSSEVQKLDFEMDKTYRSHLQSKDLYKFSTINPIGVRIAQRRWVIYRDAWIKFAALRYPNIPGDSFNGWLTAQRLTQLAYNSQYF